MINEHPILMKSTQACCSILFMAGATLLPAQNTCADLNILSLTYAAFNDSTIEVVASTAPGTFFSYPAFSLVNEQGDTITREYLNFFGVGQNAQTHTSPLVEGQSMPSSPFNGSLVFTYASMADRDTCVYPINASLCPPAPCAPLEVFVHNNGPVTDASFSWTVTDSDGNIMESGALDMNASETQIAFGDLCLPPGEYTLSIDRTSGPATTYPFGVTRDFFNASGPTSVYVPGGANELHFLFFQLCSENTNSVEEVRDGVPVVSIVDDVVTVTRRNGTALGVVEVFDVSGRTIHRVSTRETRTTVDLRTRAEGAYLLRVAGTSQHGPTSFTQRIILH